MITAKSEISLFDKNFDRNNIASYGLSIRITSDGFSFSVLNRKTNQFIGFANGFFIDLKRNHSLSEKINCLSEIYPFINDSFSTVEWISDSNDNVIIPESLFSEANKDKHYEFNLNIDYENKILFEHIHNLSIVNTFPVNLNTIKWVEEHWKLSLVTIRHYSSKLIENLYIDYINRSNDTLVYTNVSNRKMDIILFQGKNLLLSNSFNFETAEDFVYFLMNIFARSNLNPENTELVFLGDIARNSDIYKSTHRYVRNISFLRRNPNPFYSFILDELSEHRFYTLFCN
ncbi:MAG: DUF3822 family protein [Hyphomicrobiales bacterium]